MTTKTQNVGHTDLDTSTFPHTSMVAKTPKETNTPHTPSRAHVSRCIRLPRTFTVAKTATETANNGHAHLDTSTQPHTSIAAKTPKGTNTAHTPVGYMHLDT